MEICGTFFGGRFGKNDQRTVAYYVNRLVHIVIILLPSRSRWTLYKVDFQMTRISGDPIEKTDFNIHKKGKRQLWLGECLPYIQWIPEKY